MKRKSVIIGIGYLIGLFAASFFSPFINCVIALTTAALFSITSIIVKDNLRKKTVLTLGISFVTAVVMNIGYTVSVYDRIVSYSGKEAEFSGTITEFEYAGSDKMLMYVKGKLGGKTTEISLYTDYCECDYGDTVSFTGTFEQSDDKLSFQGREYSKSQGRYLHATKIKDFTLTKDNGFSLRREILHYRDYLSEKITDILPGKEGGFLVAMLCGDESMLDAKTSASLYRVGIGHIFSVSGTHLVIVCAIMMWILKSLKLGKKFAFVISEVFILLFVIFAGAGLPVLRAAFMMTAVNLSGVIKRRNDPLTTLMLCGVILTIFRPYSIRSSSFLLSMSAAFGMSVVAPFFAKAIKQKAKLRKLKTTVVSMFAVSVCMLPAISLSFNELSLVSPITNILLVPLCTFALGAATLVALTGGVSFIAVPVLTVCGLAIKLVIMASTAITSFNISYLPLGFSFIRICVIIGIVATALTVAVFKTSKSAIVMSLSVCVVLAVCGFVNSKVRQDIMSVVTLYQDDCSTLVVYNKNNAVVISLKGGNVNTNACRRLLENKGLKNIKYVSFGGASSAYASLKQYCDIEDYSDKLTDGFSVGRINVSSDENSVLISFDNSSVTITNDVSSYGNMMFVSLRKTYSMQIGEEVISLNDNENGTAYLIKLGDNNDYSVRRLDYALVD